MAINDVAEKCVYHVGDILREFLGHNSVSGLRTLKYEKNFKNLENLIKTNTFSFKNLVFSSPAVNQGLPNIRSFGTAGRHVLCT